jgi:hypothetical protein
MPDGTKLAEFVAWCQKHVTGDEKGDAHAALDTAVLTAYGFNAKKDLLAHPPSSDPMEPENQPPSP